MSYFGDMASAVEDYPASGVLHLTVVDATVHSGSANAVNVNEVWRFKVQITNFGQLDMNGVVLHLHGRNDAQVSSSPTGPWSPTISTTAVHVKASTAAETQFYYFKAPPRDSDGVEKDLVSAHVHEWTASFSSMLVNRSGNSTQPEGTYSAEVHP